MCQQVVKTNDTEGHLLQKSMELKIHDSQYVVMYIRSLKALEISQLVWCYYLDILMIKSASQSKLK